MALYLAEDSKRKKKVGSLLKVLTQWNKFSWHHRNGELGHKILEIRDVIIETEQISFSRSFYNKSKTKNPSPPNLTYFKSESIFPFTLHFACIYSNFIQKAWTTGEDDSLFNLKMHFYLLFLVSLFTMFREVAEGYL